MAIYYVCTNSETLAEQKLDSVPSDRQTCLAEESLKLITKRIGAALDPADDWEPSCDFRDWHGGRFADQASQYGYSVCGLVAHRDGTDEMAWELDEIIDDAMAEVAGIDAED